MHSLPSFDDAYHDVLGDHRILSEVRAALRNGTPPKAICRQLGVSERELRAALGEPCWADEIDDSRED